MTLLAQTGAPTAIILGGLALVIGWLLLRTHRSFRRQRGSDTTLVHTARPTREPQGHNLGAPDEMLHWEVRMHDTARELSGELDSKMRALRVLIEEADRAAARLEAATRSVQPAPLYYQIPRRLSLAGKPLRTHAGATGFSSHSGDPGTPHSASGPATNRSQWPLYCCWESGGQSAVGAQRCAGLRTHRRR